MWRHRVSVTIVELIYSETYIKSIMKGIKRSTKFNKAGKEVGCMIIVLGLHFCSTMWWVGAGGSKVSRNVYMLGLYEMQEGCGTSTNRTKKKRSASWAPQHNSEAAIAKAMPEKSVGAMKAPWLQHQEGSTGSLVTVPWILLDFLYHHQFSQLFKEKDRSQ